MSSLMESTDMGEARRRQQTDPLYGVMGKQELVTSPLWVVYEGVLFLVGGGDSLACLPASNKLPALTEEQEAVLQGIIAENPQLTVIDVVESTQT